MFRIDQWTGTKTKRIDLGLPLGLDNNEDAYIVLREMTVGEAIGLKIIQDEKERYEKIASMLTDLIVEHNFYNGEQLATNKEVSDLIGKDWKCLYTVSQEYWVFSFFIPQTNKG